MQALNQRFIAIGPRQLEGWHRQLAALERIRQSLGYENTLNRGYAVVRGDGEVLVSLKAAKKASHLEIQFADGRLNVGGPGKAKPSKSKPKKPEARQKNLFD